MSARDDLGPRQVFTTIQFLCHTNNPFTTQPIHAQNLRSLAYCKRPFERNRLMLTSTILIGNSLCGDSLGFGGVHLARRRALSYMGVHLTYGCASCIWACISYMGVHLIYGRTSHIWLSISHMVMHLSYKRASLIWAYISHMGVHLTYGHASMHLIYSCASHIWLCISYMVMHPSYGCASLSCIQFYKPKSSQGNCCRFGSEA